MNQLVTLAVKALAVFAPLFLACSQTNQLAAAAPANKSHTPIMTMCPAVEPEETDGRRRLALIIGVGAYRSKSVRPLKGPPHDARVMYDLLTEGYGFPRGNVCLLIDEDATTENVKQMFEERLIDRVLGSEDVVVFYFAGHGSKTPDLNGDETDNQDETFLFHDARVGSRPDFTDDEFNDLLAALHQKTQHITVILDSCSSGSATRAGDDYAERWEAPVRRQDQELRSQGEGDGDRKDGWVPTTLPGLVTFSAAGDGTSALERNGVGLFTAAILEVFSQAGQLTYAQAARRIPPIVASLGSFQVPYFQGDLTAFVFDNKKRVAPMVWEVKTVDPIFTISGPPLPGVGANAEFRIYDGASTAEDMRDPAKAKTTVVVMGASEDDTDSERLSGLIAEVQIPFKTAEGRPLGPGDAEVERGDLAILVRPSDEYQKLKLKLREAKSSGGVPQALAAKIRSAVLADEEASLLVEFTEKEGDFEASLDSKRRLILRDPANIVRNIFEQDTDSRLATALSRQIWLHSRQRALLALRGEGGNDFADQETLKVQLVRARRQTPCAQAKDWFQQEANKEQIIPLCYRWNLKIKLSEDSPTPLLVGAVVLTSDGSMIGIPRDGRQEKLEPGDSIEFRAKGETFEGRPPFGLRERVIGFGTQETNPVPWHLMTETASDREGARAANGTLFRVLDRYLRPGARYTAVVDDAYTEDTTWTLSSVSYRVEANVGFLESEAPDRAIQAREYTIPRFDVRPYLPDDDRDTALYKVLIKANELANGLGSDGYGYKKHKWREASDDANLRRGVDCSRAIWFAFTRSGVPYNRANKYLPTADMVTHDTWMQDEFALCDPDDELQLGDVLVYRDEQRGDGHTVMVIDPQKRIAWGSHGWDGNSRELPFEPDKGVEYQLIKYKPDWRRWDRKTMELKLCWRYRQFAVEAKRMSRTLGTKALANACDPRMCRLQ